MHLSTNLSASSLALALVISGGTASASSAYYEQTTDGQSSSQLLVVGGTPQFNTGIGQVEPSTQGSAVVEFTVSDAVTINFLATMTSMPNVTVTYWITNQIGAGTTSSNVFSTGTFETRTFNLETDTVFTGVTLNPGTYFVTLAAVNQPTNDAGWDATTAPVITSSPQISYVSTWIEGDSSTPNNFAPAYTDYSADPNFDYLFEIDGTVVTPEPSTARLAALAIAAMALASIKMMNQQMDSRLMGNLFGRKSPAIE